MSAKISLSDTEEKETATNANVHVHVAAADKDVDTAAQLAAGLDEELTPEEATRIRKKIDWHIMPLMCSTFFRSLMVIYIRDTTHAR